MINGNIIQIGLLILLTIDALVRPPLGIELLRKLFGYTNHGPVNQPCPWDMEGQWQIGTITNGRSPWQWTRRDQYTLLNNVEHIGDGSSHKSVRRANRQMARREEFIIEKDEHKIELKLGTITCRHSRIYPAASFVADPFLLRKSDNEWYMFYELKNVQRYIGEIGVSKSTDGGKSWNYQGIALTESFHLSYPFVIHDAKRRNYYMIPETNQARQVRVYRTTENDFPFGWRHAHTPLEGQRFVDTAAVHYDDRFWIYTTVLASQYDPFGGRKSTLRLYYAGDLLETWKEHPQSPIVSNNRQIGRSGGRPVVYKDNVYRFAQDGTSSYGEGVHVMRAHVLTSTQYEEQEMTFVRPADLGVARFHHLDAHENKDGSWFAFVDADLLDENDEYYAREGYFHALKRSCLSLLVILQVMKLGRNPNILRLYVGLIGRIKSKNAKSKTFRSKSGMRSLVQKVFTMGNSTKKLLTLMLGFGLFLIIFILMTDMETSCIESDSMATQRCFSGSLLGVKDSNIDTEIKQYNDPDDLVVVTAASSAFMERLRNFIGSVHYWEPYLNITIYDLGLSDSDLVEISQWKRVTVLAFPFDKYPVHVSLLYNFAWKIVMLYEALKLYPKFIYFDSGMEIRRPLTDVRYYMDKDGYYGINLQGERGGKPFLIGQATHPTTYEKIKGYGVDFDIDEVKKSPFCAGGVQGMVRGRVEDLMDTAMKCALEEECINPKGCGRSNHNWDQSALSVVAYAMGMGGYCHAENIVDNDPLGYTVDETRCNHVLMGTRRWRLPKKYMKHIDKHMRTSNILKKGDVKSFEMNQQGKMKPQGNSKWQECLRNCKKINFDGITEADESRSAWEACVQECPLDHGKDGLILMDLEAVLDYLLTRIRKGLRCKVIWLRTLLFFMLIPCVVTFSSSLKSAAHNNSIGSHLH